MLVGNRAFTNLPRKFNVTITGCLENCCHVETQDIGLVPAYRELDGRQVNGFNVLVGGKQGSGGYRPAQPLDVFARPEDAAAVCREITFIFRDHGARTQRTRARLAHLIETKGWALEVARELERRTQGQKIAPLTIHWLGRSAGCGMHGVSTIGLQACRTRLNGAVVDAAHVSVTGQTGPHAHIGKDLMYDVPCDQLADALLPLVKHLPRK